MSIYQPLRIYDRKSGAVVEFDRNGYLSKQVSEKTALHVGCCDWPLTESRIESGQLLHGMLCSSANSLVGIDLSTDGVRILKKNGYSNVMIMDAEDLTLDSKFEVLVAGDVLEHMSNPGNFLAKAESVLEKDGTLIIGVPSALTANNIRPWIRRDERVHVDHTFYFSPKTLAALCARYDFEPTKLIFTVQPATVGESRAFLAFRRFLLSTIPTMSPSIIMQFKRSADIDRSVFWIWE